MGILGERLNDASKEGNKLRNIHISIIVRNENNHYPISEIDVLKESIKEVGLLQPLTVIKQDANYTLVDGERRLTALWALVGEGFNEFEEVPCYIKNDLPDDTYEHLALILANSQKRVRTPDVILKEVESLNSIYDELAERGDKPEGKRRAWIASCLNMGDRQVQEYLTALKSDDMVEAIEDGESITKAKEKKPEKEKTPKQVLQAVVKSLEKSFDVLSDNGHYSILNDVTAFQQKMQVYIDNLD